MCFVWISEQTAIISLYSINWLVFTNATGGGGLLRGTSWVLNTLQARTIRSKVNSAEY